MVNISIDVTDLGGEARPGDKVVLWKPAAAGSATHAGRVISTAPVDVFLTNGKASVPDVEPGDMRVLLQCRGVESQGPIDVTVPDGTGTVTLRSLIEAQFEYAPPIVSAVQEAAANAAASERAAIEAQVRSEAAADRADAKVDDAINNGANLIRNEVKQDADRAVSARQAATQSESNAKASENAAASSASNAAADTAVALREEMKPAMQANAAYMGQSLAASQMATDSANAAKSSENKAKSWAELSEVSATSVGDVETRVKASETSASESATSAASSESAARISADAAVQSENRARSSAAQAQNSETSAMQYADAAAESAQLADPEGFRAEIEQRVGLVEDGLDGKAPAEHTHTSSQVDGLDAALSRLDNIRAWFRGPGAPPESIPGARVGDWWIDTDTMELHELTEV